MNGDVRYHKLHYLFFLYVFTLPFEGIWPHLIGSDPIWTPYRILGIALVGCFLVQTTVRRQSLRIDGYDRAFLFIFGFLGVTCLAFQNLAGSISTDKFVSAAILTGFGLVTYCTAKNLDLNSTTIRFVLACFSIGALINAVSVVANFSANPSGLRQAGYTDSSNTASYHFGLALLIVMGSFLSKRRSRVSHTVVATIVCLVLLFAMLTTQSRGSLAAFVGAATCVLLVSLGKRAPRHRAFSLVSLSCLLGVFLVVFLEIDLDRLLIRITGDHVTAVRALSGRDEIWAVAYSAAQDSDFRGIGLGQFYHVSGDYLRRLWWRNYNFGAVGAHSDYFTLLVETGLLGVTCYILLLGCLMMKLLRKLHRSEFQSTYVVLFSLVVYMSIGGITHSSFKRPDFWLFMALATLACGNRFQVATEYVLLKLEPR